MNMTMNIETIGIYIPDHTRCTEFQTFIQTITRTWTWIVKMCTFLNQRFILMEILKRTFGRMYHGVIHLETYKATMNRNHNKKSHWHGSKHFMMIHTCMLRQFYIRNQDWPQKRTTQIEILRFINATVILKYSLTSTILIICIKN